VDTCWTTLIGDGKLAPLVVDTWRKDIPEDFSLPMGIHQVSQGDPKKGRGRRSTLFWAKYQLDHGTFVEGDCCTLHL
jgi:hypothetical protein